MKAIVYNTYGPPEVLHTAEVETPLPAKNEVRVKVHAASVNFGDRTAREFKYITPASFHMPFLFWAMARLAFGLNTPKMRILGNEFSGTIEDVGEEVTRFKTGETVFGYTGEKMGAYAEYICLPEEGYIARKPEAISFKEAAAVPMGTIMALNILKQHDLHPGQKVLIIGASGSIGSAALQLVKQRGPEVTGVCGTPRVPYVQALGADRVIDYSKEDYSLSNEKYDLVIDVLGKSTFSQAKQVLTPKGCYLRVSFKMKELIQMFFTSFSKGKRVVCSLANTKPEDMRTVALLIDNGVIRSLLDRSFPMDKAPDAHRYAEGGAKTGSVVIGML